jgi:hypothetical protein
MGAVSKITAIYFSDKHRTAAVRLSGRDRGWPGAIEFSVPRFVGTVHSRDVLAQRSMMRVDDGPASALGQTRVLVLQSTRSLTRREEGRPALP